MPTQTEEINTFIYTDIPIKYKFIPKMAQIQLSKHEHAPTLTTVLMVEDTLKEAREVITLAELKRRLPRKVMHGTLVQIIDYLQMSGKIILGTKGVLWIFTERKELNELIQKGTEL